VPFSVQESRVFAESGRWAHLLIVADISRSWLRELLRARRPDSSEARYFRELSGGTSGTTQTFSITSVSGREDCTSTTTL